MSGKSTLNFGNWRQYFTVSLTEWALLRLDVVNWSLFSSLSEENHPTPYQYSRDAVKLAEVNFICNQMTDFVQRKHILFN